MMKSLLSDLELCLIFAYMWQTGAACARLDSQSGTISNLPQSFFFGENKNL